MADNKGIPQELIDRINELSKKKKEEGLTSEELAEQKELRETYLSLFRENFRSEERRVGKECRSRWSPYH